MSTTTGYAHTNVDQIEDLAPKYGMEFGEARVIRADIDAERVGLSYYRMKPNKRFGFGHKHHEAEEVYVILEGSGRVKIEDDILDLATLDVVRCAPEVMREFEAGPDGMVFLATGNHVKGEAL